MAKWTQEEEKSLKSDYKKLSNEKLEIKYNRKYSTISTKYYQLVNKNKTTKKVEKVEKVEKLKEGMQDILEYIKEIIK